jgi:hypothetical protein
MEHPTNPLKSITSYNLLELQNICNKLSIETKNIQHQKMKLELVQPKVNIKEFFYRYFIIYLFLYYLFRLKALV